MKEIKGFKNTWILTEDGLKRTDLLVKNGIVEQIGQVEDEGLLQLEEDKILVPGFIDRHIHGADGSDIIDGTEAAVEAVANALAREGTTAFLATTTTESPETIKKALAAVDSYMKALPHSGAEVLGVHLEGPFISRAYLGAQLPECAVPPDVETFKDYETAGGSIRLVSMAVEENGAEKLVSYLVAKGIGVSAGHSAASYAQMERALSLGVTGVTHTYNAQSPLHHREVGVVGAALLLDGLYCEAICDGIHLSREAVRLLYKSKPADKVVLITDSLRAKYLPDGVYTEPCGQRITVNCGQARLDDGTLAGSTLKMNGAVKNAMEFLGIDLAAAVRLAAENPAKSLGVFDRMGSIAVGKQANFVVTDKKLKVYQTVRGGRIIYSV